MSKFIVSSSTDKEDDISWGHDSFIDALDSAIDLDDACSIIDDETGEVYLLDRLLPYIDREEVEKTYKIYLDNKPIECSQCERKVKRGDTHSYNGSTYCNKCFGQLALNYAKSRGLIVQTPRSLMAVVKLKDVLLDMDGHHKADLTIDLRERGFSGPVVSSNDVIVEVDTSENVTFDIGSTGIKIISEEDNSGAI